MSDDTTVKSTQELDLERRLLEGDSPNQPDKLYPTAPSGSEARSFATEDTEADGYVGVSPEYMTHANDTEKPLAADGGAEAKAEELNKDVAPINKTEPVKVEAVTTQGVGSSAPLLYPHVSGDDFTQEEVSGTTPTKVEDAAKLPSGEVSEVPEADQKPSPTTSTSPTASPTPSSPTSTPTPSTPTS